METPLIPLVSIKVSKLARQVGHVQQRMESEVGRLKELKRVFESQRSKDKSSWRWFLEGEVIRRIEFLVSDTTTSQGSSTLSMDCRSTDTKDGGEWSPWSSVYASYLENTNTFGSEEVSGTPDSNAANPSTTFFQMAPSPNLVTFQTLAHNKMAENMLGK
jgi:hypothetical protein